MRRRQPLLGKQHAQPLQLEIAFAKRIDELFARLAATAMKVATAQVKRTQDSAESDHAALVRRLRANNDFSVDEAEALVGEVANHNARQMQRSLRAVRPSDDGRSIAVQIPELSAANVRRHAERTAREINAISDSVAERISPLVEKAVSRGLRGEELAAELQQKLGLEKAQAKRVAIGQVIRINSAITEERHRKLGIRRYKWRSTNDSHTRRWHRELNNTIQSYDDPPEGGGGGPHDRGNPGSADVCRCQAIPVIDDPAHLAPPRGQAANDDEPASPQPFASKEAFDAHAAARGFEPVAPEAYGELRKVLGAKLSPRDIDALAGQGELSAIPGERKTIIRNLKGGGVRFDARVDIPGSIDRVMLRRTYTKARTDTGWKLVAKHDQLALPESLQGQGIGKRLLAEQVKAYERLGVKQVRLDAEWIGRYYWPKIGFDVHPDQLPEWVERFRRYLTSQKLPREALKAMTSGISSMRDIAITMVGDRKIGKDFLLQVSPIEDLSVDVGSPAYRTMKKELGLTEAPSVKRTKPRKPRAKRSAA